MPAPANKLDLHGYTAQQALETFLSYYNRQVRAGVRHRIEVVHGYGSSGEGGLIRKRLRAFLSAFPDRVSFTPGENLDGNPGNTLVHPKSLLPEKTDTLQAEILAYCRIARTEEKILGEFRRYGDAEVMATLKTLAKQGRLATKWKGKNKRFQVGD
jgi:hypothetical protein